MEDTAEETTSASRRSFYQGSPAEQAVQAIFLEKWEKRITENNKRNNRYSNNLLEKTEFNRGFVFLNKMYLVGKFSEKDFAKIISWLKNSTFCNPDDL